jgi:tetratricopeptide (TPR) repeat protein
VTNAEAQRREQIIDDAVAVGDLQRAEEEAKDYCADTESLPEGGAVSPRFRARYLAAQVDLAAGRLSAALDRVEPLLPLCDGLGPELAARLRLLAAEASARLDREDEARAQLALVPAAPLESRPLLRLRALRVRLWLGDLNLVGDDLAACARELEASGDTANPALLLCEEGRALDRAGDVPAALACWRRADDLTRPHGDAAIRADVLVQLGRADHLRGHLGAAVDHFDAACRCAAGSPHAAEAMLRRTLVRLELGHREQAAAEAARLLRGPPDALPEELRPLANMARVLLADGECASDGSHPPPADYEVRAYVAARRGDADAARALYSAALAAEPSAERRARLALALGMLAAGGRDAAEARAWLGEAESLARTHDLPEVLVRVLQMAGQLAAEEEGDDALARGLFEEAVLITEAQAERFRKVPGIEFLLIHAYRQKRGSVLRHLLRAACRRGDAARAFLYQELERGRLLLDLLHTDQTKTAGLSLFSQPKFVKLQNRIAACDQALTAADQDASTDEGKKGLWQQRQVLLLQRDRLFEEFLRNRSRRGNALLPMLPELADLQRALPARTIYVAPTLVGDELYVLLVAQGGPTKVLRGPGSAVALARDVEDLRACLTAQLARYRHGLPMGGPQRLELDDRLDQLGRGPLGIALTEALESQSDRPKRVLWAPDDVLHGFPIHALRIGGRYLIEDFEFVWTFSGALLVHQARRRKHRRGWILRPALVVTEKPADLPEAEGEGEGVAATFFWSRRLPPEVVNRTSLRSWLARARVAHFACHAEFDGQRPLAARLILPSGEAIHALEWLEEPVAGLPLVTLSACRSAEVAPLVGREVFGLVTGLLGSGVRAVLAGLWTVADREVPPLMWRFYRHRLLHDLPTALALAQREALEGPGSSPLFWAVFALFGDGNALPAPGILGRFLARRRYHQHRQRFPT